MRYESQSSGVTLHHPPLSAVYHTQTQHDITVLCVAVIICCFFHISKLFRHSSQSFIYKNKELFIINATVHKIPTRSQNDLYLPIANLSAFQRGVYFSGLKVFNNLPVRFKQTFYDVCRFKHALKSFILENSFYLLEE